MAYSSTLSETTKTFTMKHKMGLVQLVPKSKAVTKTLTWNYNKSDGGYTETKSGTNDGTVTASSAFTGNRPLNALSKYWHIVKSTSASSNTAMSFTCDANQTDYWSAVSSGTNVGYGGYKSIDIYSDRTAQYLVALFSCQGTCQTVTLPWYGTYKIECWGASGGLSPQGTTQVPGRGGYTKGNITLGKVSLYVYVGGQGYSNINVSNKNNAGGWNGGGASSCNSGAPYCGSGGGGSTDVRVIPHSNGEWGYSSSSGADASFRTRIMVAAGGGGCDGYYGGGHGGGTTGGTSTTTQSYTPNTGATQKSTGSQTTSTNWRGYFGYANQVNNLVSGNGNGNGGGGGGGWWGGSNGYGTGGSGGSSFISGMSGCVAINSAGVQTDGVSIMTINNVSYTFVDAVTYGGGHVNRPANPGEGVNTYGDGYAKITSQ